jgi:hypothetical protein
VTVFTVSRAVLVSNSNEVAEVVVVTVSLKLVDTWLDTDFERAVVVAV